MIRVQQLDHIALAVQDVAFSAQWYADLLGLERRYADVWGDVPTMMCAGDTCIALFPAQGEQIAILSSSVGLQHIAFRVDYASFEQAQRVLREKDIAFEFSDHTISHSIYFSDPDGYRLELTTYDLTN